MEFIPLRSLQRGEPRVWEALRQGNGRIVLTSNSQPAYLLVDLAGKNVVPLINWIDYYRANPEFSDGSPPLPVEETLTHEQKKAAERFLDAMREIKKEGLSQKDKTALSELNSGKYREGFDRSSEL